MRKHIHTHTCMNKSPSILSEIHCILKRIHYFNPFYDADNEIKSYIKWKVQMILYTNKK